MQASTYSFEQLLQSLSTMLSIGDGSYILSLARDLSARRDPSVQMPRLKDRNVALVLDEQDPHNIFSEAALELGARVSNIKPSLTTESSAEEIQQTSRVLGCLYSAIEWPDVPPELMKQIRKEAAIPVYGGISVPGSALHEWAGQLDIEATAEEKWRWVIQAILLRDLA